MPNSLVRKAELKNNQIVLTVQVADYMQGKSVVVYGYISQDSGTFYKFRQAEEVNPAPGKDTAQLTVTVPVEKELEFDPHQKMTVLTWVSEFWPSTLKPVNGADGSWIIDNDASDRWREYADSADW